MVVAQALSLLLWDVALLGASFAATLLPGARAACGGSTVSGPAWACRRGGALLASRSHVSLFVELLVFGALLVGLICAPLLRALFAATPGGAAAKSGAQRAGRRAGRGRGVDLRVVGALALVVGCAAAAAAFPAAWALEFALGTWRRAALLGYWVLILAAALPAMDWVSRARRVPTIIVRKVWSALFAVLHCMSERAFQAFAPLLPCDPRRCQRSDASIRCLYLALGACNAALRSGKPARGPRVAMLQVALKRACMRPRATTSWRWRCLRRRCCWSRSCWRYRSRSPRRYWWLWRWRAWAAFPSWARASTPS